MKHYCMSCGAGTDKDNPNIWKSGKPACSECNMDWPLYSPYLPANPPIVQKAIQPRINKDRMNRPNPAGQQSVPEGYNNTQ